MNRRRFLSGCAAAALLAALPKAAALPLGGASPVAGTLPTFQLTSPNTGTQPFTIGMPFPKGAAVGSLTLNTGSAQVVPMRFWNDGSVKHAIISGAAALTANTPLTVNVIAGSSAGANLTATDIANAAPSASVVLSGGLSATVNLSSLLASPVRTFVSGPQMVECHYKQRVANGASSPLLVLFHVRLYKSGRLWLSIKIENGYMTGSATVTYTAVVTVGGTQIFNGSITHYANTIAYMPDAWIGGDPQVQPTHDMRYVVNTKLVPNYMFVPPDAATLNALTQSYAIGANGGFTPSMGQAGAQLQIGLLPAWEVMLINSLGDTRAWNSMIANGRCLGSYAISWRDLNTDAPMVISANPSAFLDNSDQTFSGAANALTWELNHHPSVGYLGYMLTGRYQDLETMQLQATLCYFLCNPATFGSGTGRYVQDSQVRGRAWAMRTAGQMCALCPTSDPGLADWQTLMNNMALSDLSNAVAPALGGINTPGWSQLGVAVHPGGNFSQWTTQGKNGGTPTTSNTISSWMQNFNVQAYGMVSDAEWGSAAQMANWNQVRDFQYKWPVGLLGDGLGGAGSATGWCFNWADAYGVQVAPLSATDPADFVAQWFTDWGTTAAQNANLNGIACVNTLTPGVPPGDTHDPGMVSSYWANLLPAISYAVDHGAPGAAAAYARILGASNFAVMRDGADDTPPNWGDQPQWGIHPRSDTTPWGS